MTIHTADDQSFSVECENAPLGDIELTESHTAAFDVYGGSVLILQF